MTRSSKASGCLPDGYRCGGAIRPRRGAVFYYLGLGSNLGERGEHIGKALAFLAECGRVLKRSSVYETTPVAMDSAKPFLNMVVALESPLKPLELLVRCKGHEAAQGRDLKSPPYRDRPIDIDILLAGDLVLATPELTVPHPRLCERGFVLVPLFEIAPKLLHPVEKVTVARLLSRLKGSETVRRLD
ncbi:MAG: 2-amino-4-hydroxy-6-hydroxymethyldihydropteridine diphosphokinase [Acidobacteria bacterium]|jgi:2-amino-4-hydroxy-6-hydroxymethyldihydropteridine diphosphokinase|nr:2-amino-4-hydroxy-6-hydroxymethyldihydropteridine diphosphokinase [Acidobacteriota bacterium]